jgi:hypothetical protein
MALHPLFKVPVAKRYATSELPDAELMLECALEQAEALLAAAEIEHAEARAANLRAQVLLEQAKAINANAHENAERFFAAIELANEKSANSLPV